MGPLVVPRFARGAIAACVLATAAALAVAAPAVAATSTITVASPTAAPEQAVPVDLTFSGPNNQSGVVASALIAAPLTTGVAVGKVHKPKAAPVPADVYAGWSAQKDPLWFSVSAGAKRITASGAAIDVACTPSGIKFTTVDRVTGVSVAANGHFAARNALPLTANPDGSQFSASDAVTGAISANHKTITGTWTLTLSFVAPPGSNTPTDTCTSGPVGFKVHA